MSNLYIYIFIFVNISQILEIEEYLGISPKIKEINEIYLMKQNH